MPFYVTKLIEGKTQDNYESSRWTIFFVFLLFNVSAGEILPENFSDALARSKRDQQLLRSTFQVFEFLADNFVGWLTFAEIF